MSFGAAEEAAAAEDDDEGASSAISPEASSSASAALAFLRAAFALFDPCFFVLLAADLGETATPVASPSSTASASRFEAALRLGGMTGQERGARGGRILQIFQQKKRFNMAMSVRRGMLAEEAPVSRSGQPLELVAPVRAPASASAAAALLVLCFCSSFSSVFFFDMTRPPLLRV